MYFKFYICPANCKQTVISAKYHKRKLSDRSPVTWPHNAKSRVNSSQWPDIKWEPAGKE